MDHSMGTAAGGFRSKFHPSSSIDTSFEPPLQPDFDEPPAPSGNPLLDNNELQYLTSFLLGVNSNLQNGTATDPPGFPDLFNMHHIHTEDWRTPFEVVGHNVTYGDMQLEDGVYTDEAHLTSAILGSMMPASGSDQLQQINHARHDRSDVPGEADAFAAALALTHAGQSFNQTHTPYSISSPPDPMMSSADSQPGQQHHIPYRMASGQPQNNHFSFNPTVPHQGGRSTLGGPMSMGSFGGSRFYSKRPRVPHEVQFGSDPSFNRNTFVPKSAKDTTEALSAIQMETLKCLERTDSAAPTRAQSPVSFQPHSQDTRRESFAFSPSSLRTTHHPLPSHGADHEDGSARKRRKSNRDGDDYDAPAQRVSWAAGLGGLPTPTTDSGAQRQTLNATATPADPPSKSRRQPPGSAPAIPEAPPTKKGRGARRTASGTATTGPKPRRQNLTKEEKRQRHNQSEQRRRGYTKNNYEALRSLIPEVRDGRYSKAATLKIVADLLESMHAGNDALRMRVEEVAPGRLGPSVLEMARQKKKKKGKDGEARKRKEMEMAHQGVAVGNGSGKLVLR
ncbi:hypothetical protein VTJ49DRAFT_1182 [Mycothermus thermophilus]|uniref:BHLH domain-containing protein n=1 Tax=Humicola insolens TaxID=85995 RepID=A0ABR3VD34_HUMIN